MVNEVMDFITGYDKEVGEAIQAECARQRRNLELIASENIVSEPVMMAMGTVLTNKYAEGYSGKRYYGAHVGIQLIPSQERRMAVYNLASPPCLRKLPHQILLAGNHSH